MIIVYANAYEGGDMLYSRMMAFEDEKAKLDRAAAYSLKRRVGFWRIRPKTQKAFQTLHSWACIK